MKNRVLSGLPLMDRCLALASQGAGWVSPNPMVGCVIVRDGKIVGEGYHEYFGGSHAEVNALRQAGKRARGATLYVNLEPCAHDGKTPPCVDAILKAGIRKVIIACKDPNPLVSGKGIRIFKRGGVTVEIGLRRSASERLNEKFFTFMKRRRPFVGVKVAQTLDGRIADGTGRSKWITTESSRRHAHRLRATYDAVLVGAKTVLLDNPELTVRSVKGRSPLRVVLDGRLTVDPASKVFNTKITKTLLFTTLNATKRKRSVVSRLVRKGVQIITMDAPPHLQPTAILNALRRLGVSSVLVEGGSETISAFLQRRCVDKIHCFIAQKILGSGLTSFSLSQPFRISNALRLTATEVRQFDSDVYMEGSVKYP